MRLKLEHAGNRSFKAEGRVTTNGLRFAAGVYSAVIVSYVKAHIRLSKVIARTRWSDLATIAQ
jgi:hypothetical protein